MTHLGKFEIDVLEFRFKYTIILFLKSWKIIEINFYIFDGLVDSLILQLSENLSEKFRFYVTFVDGLIEISFESKILIFNLIHLNCHKTLEESMMNLLFLKKFHLTESIRCWSNTCEKETCQMFD